MYLYFYFFFNCYVCMDICNALTNKLLMTGESKERTDNISDVIR